MQLGGGYLFGLLKGFATDCIGATAGATAAFLVGKTVRTSALMSHLVDCTALVCADEKSVWTADLLGWLISRFRVGTMFADIKLDGSFFRSAGVM